MNSCFASRALAAVYGATILLSAFLLFQVQPIISKTILPWFGGSPAVWTTCMVFFQIVLFGGYTYAFAIQKIGSPKRQAILHCLLVAAALIVLPIVPSASWKPLAGEPPTLRILGLLAVTVGLPYFVLSATGPIVQTWFARAFVGRSPYRLYALSNFGSLAALISYPFVVEPSIDLLAQASWWSIGFGVFAALITLGGVTSVVVAPTGRTATEPLAQGVAAAPSGQTRLLWLALPALAAMMLLATTNHVCQDVAVVPFLWIAPLSLYLLSFIICFDHDRWYWRKGYALATIFLLVAVAGVDQLITTGSGIRFSFAQELTLYMAALFSLCMTCHGELARLKPDPRYLTSFYLMISAGGAIGGLFVSLVAPQIFHSFFEWKLGLIAGVIAAGLVAQAAGGRNVLAQRRRLMIAIPLALIAFIGISGAQQLAHSTGTPLELASRDFYGTVNVSERDVADPEQHKFVIYSGRIVHGMQFAEADKRMLPTVYYGPQSGMGRVLSRLGERGLPTRVGVIGLGCGTAAAYCGAGQYFRFYELNPTVVAMAREHFSYLADCGGRHDVVIGDARLSLEQEAPQEFDVLVIDAFSGDAVPTHLLTREAMDIFVRHLTPRGEIVVNISNRYLDLQPIVRGLAEYAGFAAVFTRSAGDVAAGTFPAEWMILSRDKTALAAQQSAEPDHNPSGGRSILWTDRQTDLVEILK